MGIVTNTGVGCFGFRSMLIYDPAIASLEGTPTSAKGVAGRKKYNCNCTYHEVMHAIQQNRAATNTAALLLILLQIFMRVAVVQSPPGLRTILCQ
jgi:hypothetical protein